MARLITTGTEIEATSAAGFPDATGTNGPTRDTITFRSGVASSKCASGAFLAYVTSAGANPYAASATRFARIYLLVDALPASAVVVMAAAANLSAIPANGVSAKLTSGGKLQLFNEATDVQIGSDSVATIAINTWYRIEIETIQNASSQVTDAELRLDGTTVASTTGATIAGSTQLLAGNLNGGAGVNAYVDDVALNSDAGAANNSWPGDGKIILMFPISDNARGNWTGGGGGTTNLFEGVNNTPPVGVADPGTDASQIKIKSTSLPSSCDLNLATYTAAGVTGTVNALVLWENDGEDPATGTKAGTAEIVSNPASGTVSFNFGDDSGTQGTYNGNWKWHSKTVDAPSVTLGTAPVVRITCVSGSTGTRAASCDCLGVYVDYTPPAAAGAVFDTQRGALSDPSAIQNAAQGSQAVNRASVW